MNHGYHLITRLKSKMFKINFLNFIMLGIIMLNWFCWVSFCLLSLCWVPFCFIQMLFISWMLFCWILFFWIAFSCVPSVVLHYAISKNVILRLPYIILLEFTLLNIILLRVVSPLTNLCQELPSGWSRTYADIPYWERDPSVALHLPL